MKIMNAFLSYGVYWYIYEFANSDEEPIHNLTGALVMLALLLLFLYVGKLKFTHNNGN